MKINWKKFWEEFYKEPGVQTPTPDSIKAIQKVIDEQLNPTSSIKKKSLQDLNNFIQEKFNISIDELKTKNRTIPYVRVRHIYSYLGLIQGYGPSQVARQIDRDHSTVLHSKEVVIDFLNGIEGRPFETNDAYLMHEFLYGAQLEMALVN